MTAAHFHKKLGKTRSVWQQAKSGKHEQRWLDDRGDAPDKNPHAGHSLEKQPGQMSHLVGKKSGDSKFVWLFLSNILLV
jgi:hypothetical protein